MAALLVAAGTIAASCTSGPEAGTPPGAAAGGGVGMPVGVVALAEKPIEESGLFVGVLKSRRSTRIQPQAEGFITKILATAGDRVSSGTPLFEIDANVQQAAVASLESMRIARDADASFARQQAERAKAMLDIGAMSRQEYELAVTQQRTAEAQLEAIQDQIRQQQAELAYYRVVAPTAGVVGDIPVRVGDRVTKATPLTTVEDNSALEVYINVPVQQAARLRIGLPVRILSDAGEVLATERVTFVSPTVDDETQTVLVKTPLDARGGRFRTDQTVKAAVIFDTHPGLTVPVVSVTRINGQFFVFVAESSGSGLIARQRPVSLGDVVGSEYVVRSGLAPGDRLIVSGTQKIGDGAPVTAMPAAPPPAAAGGPAGAKTGGE